MLTAAYYLATTHTQFDDLIQRKIYANSVYSDNLPQSAMAAASVSRRVVKKVLAVETAEVRCSCSARAGAALTNSRIRERVPLCAVPLAA